MKNKSNNIKKSDNLNNMRGSRSSKNEAEFFLIPDLPKQRQYEALRAFLWTEYQLHKWLNNLDIQPALSIGCVTILEITHIM